MWHGMPRREQHAAFPCAGYDSAIKPYRMSRLSSLVSGLICVSSIVLPSWVMFM